MYFNINEKPIIETFYKNIETQREGIFILEWEQGQIKANFDTCFDDYNLDNEEDEFTSFVFKKLEVAGTPPVDIEYNDYFTINYHNFPSKITMNGNIMN